MHWIEITDMGWRHPGLKASLNEYLREKAPLYINLSLEVYAQAVGQEPSDFETKRIKSFCMFTSDLEIQRLLTFYALDVQRENGGFDKVIEIDYRYENEGGLWASGLAIKKKQ